ncbi:lipopolysaccharide biosynthesis protein [Microbispora sp. NPDC004025]
MLPTLSLIALVRVTGAETSGHVIFAQSLANFWFLVFDPCLERATQRFVPIEQERTGHGCALFLRLLRLDVGIALAATVVALAAVLGAWISGILSADLALMLVLSVAGRGVMAPYGMAFTGFAIADRLRVSGLLRVQGALVSFGLSLAGLFTGGPVLYLAGQAVGALLVAAVLCLLASRAVARSLGPAVGSPRLPAGMVRFTLPTSIGTIVAGISDTGILTIAGFVGGPPLVAILKITMAPGRFYATLATPVAAMLYPRLAQAIARGAGAAVIRRDIVRTTLLMTGGGALTAAIGLPLIGPVIAMAYGAEFADTGVVAVLLLGAACVKGLVCWCNVLPLATGKPGWRLAYLCAEAALLVAALLIAAWTSTAALTTALLFAWGRLLIAILGTGFWITSLRRVITSDPHVRLPDSAARPTQAA